MTAAELENYVAECARRRYDELLKRGREWLGTYEPCGTPGCESPTCQLAYAMQRAIAARLEMNAQVLVSEPVTFTIGPTPPSGPPPEAKS